MCRGNPAQTEHWQKSESNATEKTPRQCRPCRPQKSDYLLKVIPSSRIAVCPSALLPLRLRRVEAFPNPCRFEQKQVVNLNSETLGDFFQRQQAGILLNPEFVKLVKAKAEFTGFCRLLLGPAKGFPEFPQPLLEGDGGGFSHGRCSYRRDFGFCLGLIRLGNFVFGMSGPSSSWTSIP